MGFTHMITSRQNERVKGWKKLHQSKIRKETGLFLVEGYHLIEEAWKSDWEITEIVIRDGSIIPDFYQTFPYTFVTADVFSHISHTKSPQGVLAVIRKQATKQNLGNLVLLIDTIQDPGNLGTMIRTADAAGFSSIVIGSGTVDIFNDKVIRATQGSLFHLPIIQEDLSTCISRLKQSDYTIWATALEQATPYNDVPICDKTALLIGNEGAGVQPHLLKQADEIVTIPIYGQAESLNASIAAGILMYHLRRH